MYTITMRTAPMASGAIGVPPNTDSPIVRTRKNVPMNSVRYLFTGVLLRVWRRQHSRARDGNAREMVHRTAAAQCFTFARLCTWVLSAWPRTALMPNKRSEMLEETRGWFSAHLRDRPCGQGASKGRTSHSA